MGPKRRKRSFGWKYFVQLEGDREEFAKCKKCGLEVKMNRGGTSGLLRHLSYIHNINGATKGSQDPLRDTDDEEGFEETETDTGKRKRKDPLSLQKEDEQQESGAMENASEETSCSKLEPSSTSTVKRRRLRSSVWKYFIPMRSQETSKSKLCGVMVKAKAGCTTGLGRHLSTVHNISLGFSNDATWSKEYLQRQAEDNDEKGVGGEGKEAIQKKHPGALGGWGTKVKYVPGVMIEDEENEDIEENYGDCNYSDNDKASNSDEEDSVEIETDKSPMEACFACHAKFEGGSVPQYSLRECRFLLMEMLEIPVGQSLDYLKRLETPEKWMALCQPCHVFVRESMSTKNEIFRLQLKLDKCQENFLKGIKTESAKTFGEYPGRGREVMERIRKFARGRKSLILGMEGDPEERSRSSEQVIPEVLSPSPVSPFRSVGGDDDEDIDQPEPESITANTSAHTNQAHCSSSSKGNSSSSQQIVKRSQKFLRNRKNEQRRRLKLGVTVGPVEQCKRYLYDCPNCPAVKNYSVIKFVFHLATHQKRPFQCSVCSDFLPSDESAREQHWQEKHSNAKLPPDTEKFFQVKFQPGKIWKCDGYSCSAGFFTEAERDEHERTCLHEQPEGKKPYSCKFCEDVKFRNIPEWRLHRALHHPTEDYMSCYYCDESFCERTVEGIEARHEVRMQQHMSKVHCNSVIYEDCETCGVAIDNAKERRDHFREKHRISRSELYSCWICQSTRGDLPGLRAHISRIHFQAGSSVCELCGTKLLSPVSLQQHKFLLHGIIPEGGRVHDCPEPGCSFKSVIKKKVDVHLKNVHEAEKSRGHVCSTCGKSFKSTSHLRYHSQIHANEGSKPYQCEICGAAFAVQIYLTIHKRQRHGDVVGRQRVNHPRFRDRDKKQVGEVVAEGTSSTSAGTNAESMDYQSLTMFNL